MEPEFRDIPGFPNYAVSRAGEVYSKVRKKLLKKQISRFGYYRVALYGEGIKPVFIMVHRLVAMAYIPNPNGLPQVNHKNEIKTDNRVENLEWCSCSYNINYGNRNEAVKEKLIPLKTKTAGKKINQIDVITGEIVRVWDSMHQIERVLKIAHGNIYACCSGKRKTRGGFRWEYAS